MYVYEFETFIELETILMKSNVYVGKFRWAECVF